MKHDIQIKIMLIPLLSTGAARINRKWKFLVAALTLSNFAAKWPKTTRNMSGFWMLKQWIYIQRNGSVFRDPSSCLKAKRLSPREQRHSAGTKEAAYQNKPAALEITLPCSRYCSAGLVRASVRAGHGYTLSRHGNEMWWVCAANRLNEHRTLEHVAHMSALAKLSPSRGTLLLNE